MQDFEQPFFVSAKQKNPMKWHGKHNFPAKILIFFLRICPLGVPKGQPDIAQGGAHGGVGRGDLAYKSDASDVSDISIGRIDRM